MSDRVAVMNAGVVEQVDSPRTLYEQPATAFVAGFIGTSNLLTIPVDSRDNGTAIARLGEGMRICCPDPGGSTAEITFTVRPEKIKRLVDRGPENGSCVRGRVLENVYLGSMTQLIVEIQTGERLIVHELNDESQGVPVAPGTELLLGWKTENSFVVNRGELP
jgi:spermidine/putrescine transport system ATP-binding protein